MRAKYLPVLMMAVMGLAFAGDSWAHEDCDDDDDVSNTYQPATAYGNEAVYGQWDDNSSDCNERGNPDLIRERVQRTLWRNMGQSAAAIRVDVQGRSVFLSGWVRSTYEHDRAHDLAHQVPGVIHVYHNDLRVRRNRYYDDRY